MTIKLTQKKFLKGTREFELVDDTISVRIKGLLKEERLTVGLSTIDPVPVVNGAELEFYSHYQGRPLLSLYVDNPNKEEFNAFVERLKEKISGETTDFGGVNMSDLPEGMEHNVFDEPADFDKSMQPKQKKEMPDIKVERLKDDLIALKKYYNDKDTDSFIASVEQLIADPKNEELFNKMVDEFNFMGLSQGAVLTYAPYLKVLLSNTLDVYDPFANH